MKTLLLFLFFFSTLAHAQTRDSIISRIVVNCYTTTVYDTIQVPVIPPVIGNVILKGVYVHPDNVTIGSASSEDAFLKWCNREGFNMLNCYARAYLYTSEKRDQFARFVKKAKESYGVILVTNDVRLTNSSELPGWKAYFAKYVGTISMIEPLTEFEPYVKNSAGVYDYPGFFNLVRTMGNLCKQYGVKFNFYEGWIGNNYSNPQAAVDSLVKYTDRIFISNYISIADFNSLGAWDGRMDKRCNAIAVSCKKTGKHIDIVEIISLQTKYSFSLYACPNPCNSFFGSLWQKAITEYNKSTTDVLKYTDLVGRTMFVSYTAKQAHP